MALGYIPDRAYYFVVSRTIDLGILGWSPVNLCPPENGPDMPCPVPAGAVLPWQASPAEAALPQPRTQGAGGAARHEPAVHRWHGRRRDPSATTYVGDDRRGQLRRLGARARRCPRRAPTPRSRSSAAPPTSSAASGRTASRRTRSGRSGSTPTRRARDVDRGRAVPAWYAEPDRADIPLPEPRSGAAAVAVTDGIVVAGGLGAGRPADVHGLEVDRSTPRRASWASSRTSRACSSR